VLTHFPWNPKTGSSDWQTEAVLGLLGIMSFLRRKMWFFLDPREIVVLKTGVLFIFMDFRLSEKRFAIK
jgi:hypothetical protein